jgi:hypothetical protein
MLPIRKGFMRSREGREADGRRTPIVLPAQSVTYYVTLCAEFFGRFAASCGRSNERG